MAKKIKITIKKKFIPVDLKYNTPYLQRQILESYNAPVIEIHGNRGIGKSFGFKLEDFIYCIEHDCKCLYVVQTKEHIKTLSVNNGEKFIGRIKYELKHMKSKRKQKWLSYFTESSVQDEVEKGEDGNVIIKKGIIKLAGKYVGDIIAFDDFANLKSTEFDPDYKRIIVDEYITEKHDIRTRDNPKKISSVIQSVFRTSKDVKIRLLGNTVSIKDPMLLRLKIDDMKKGEIRIIYMDGELFMVSHYLNEDNYPLFKKKREESVAGKFASYLEEDYLERNDFKDLVDEDLIIPARREKSKYFRTIVGEGTSLRIHKVDGRNLFYVLEDYGKVKHKICFDKRFCAPNTYYNAEYKDYLINLFNNNLLLFSSNREYNDFKLILKLE